MTNDRKRIYLSPPHMGEHEERLISDAFRTNWIAPLGPHVDAFESEMAEYLGVKGAVALSSGTAAIHMALRLLNVERQDIVFCSTLTFVASANPILYQGAKPVFIDSEPNSWNMSPLALERAFAEAAKEGKLPKAVIVVNVYGQSADMELLTPICDQYNTPIIEDAAESLGATYQGKASGTQGKFGIYSFNGNKIITTSGGGMIVSDDQRAMELTRHLAAQAREPGRHYQHSQMGHNYRLSNVLAAIGRGQLTMIKDRIEARRQVFHTYYKHLSQIEGISFMPEMYYGNSTRWLTALTINPSLTGVDSSLVIDWLAEQNIEARPVWKPLHLQPLFREYRHYSHREEDNVSERLFQTGLCLPSGSNMTEEDQFRVIECVADCFKVNKDLKIS